MYLIAKFCQWSVLIGEWPLYWITLNYFILIKFNLWDSRPFLLILYIQKIICWAEYPFTRDLVFIQTWGYFAKYKRHSKRINIMKFYDIYIIFQLSVENDTFEPLGSWCCVSGTVTAKLRLEKKGYTVKESVPVCAEIKNLSSRRISSTSVSLIQVIWNVTIITLKFVVD